MPYVQSERSILYSLHRSACCRRLQAGRERELVPGLCVERHGLLEMMISCNAEEWELQNVVRCSSVCVCVSLRESLSVCACMEMALVTPFYS